MTPKYRVWTIAMNVALLVLAVWIDSSDLYVNPLWFVVAVVAANIVLSMVE